MTLMTLSAADLRIFHAVVEGGSISAAARTLRRDKSSVSRDLARLEERVGHRLVQRTTRRLSLTEAGSVLAAHAERVVAELAEAEASLDALHSTPRGLLRATAPFAFIRFVLAPRMDAFLGRHPHLRLAIDPTTRVLDLVEEGIDVAIRNGDMPDSSLVARKLCESSLVLVASPAYAGSHGLPATPDDLARHHLIDLRATPDTASWCLHGPSGRHDVAVSPRASFPDPSTVIDLAEAGGGIGLVPDLYASAPVRHGTLLRVLPAFHLGRRPVQAVFPSRRQVPPKVEAFLAFATACMREVGAGGAGEAGGSR